MAAQYPGAIFSATSPASKRDAVFTQDELCAILDEIEAIETTLGVSPGDSAATGVVYGSVDARLEALESGLAGLGRTALTNLRITNNTSTPNTQLDISWSLLGIQGALSQSFAHTLDRTVTGANGRDQAITYGNSTWYWLYAIYNPQTSTAATLLSAAQPTPNALPTGYTLYRRIGAVVTDTGGSFRRYVQIDREVRFMHSGDTFVVDGSNSTYTARSLAYFVPETTRFCRIQCTVAGPTADGAAYLVWQPAGWGALTVRKLVQVYKASERDSGEFDVIVNDSGSITIGFDTSPAAGALHYVGVSGFTDPV